MDFCGGHFALTNDQEAKPPVRAFGTRLTAALAFDRQLASPKNLTVNKEPRPEFRMTGNSIGTLSQGQRVIGPRVGVGKALGLGARTSLAGKGVPYSEAWAAAAVRRCSAP